MKNFIVLSNLFFVSIFALNAQEKIVKRYKSGQIASIETIISKDANQVYGLDREKVEVFNKNGDKVFEGYRRNTAGHSSVQLTYYENGGVHKINTSSAPDAGIQWYKSNRILDEEGNIIHFEEYSNEDKMLLLITNPPEYQRTKRPGTDTEEKKENEKLQQEIQKKESEIPQKKENECASPMESQIYLHNKSGKTLEIKVIPIIYGITSVENSLFIAKEDSLKLGSYIHAETFKEPNLIYEIQIRTKKRKSFETIKLDSLPLKTSLKYSQSKLFEYYYF
jgi:hypothetical protein